MPAIAVVNRKGGGGKNTLPARAQALIPAQDTRVHGDRFTRAATVR